MIYSVIKLSGTIRETGKLARNISSGRTKIFRLDEFRALVDSLLKQRKHQRIVIDCCSDFHPGFFSGLSVVRGELLRLKKAGRELHFCGRDFSPVTLYLASICNDRYINLCGTVSYTGLARTFTFFKGTLDQQGVEVQVFRRGKYKSANDPYRLKKLDPANREQWEAIYQAIDEELRKGILSGYRKDDAEMEALLNGRMLSSEEAVDEGWADEILTVSELEERWKKEKVRQKKYKTSRSWGRGTGIAVLHFEGGIMEGRSRQDPLLGQILGARSFIPEVKKIKKDRRIKGVVLRVNCPGGSPIASEEVAAALGDLAAEKPLVVSMADVAGSGGYWISTLGGRLFTEKTTVTGSIGVIAMMIQTGKLMKKWGVSQGTIKTGPYADMGSPGRSMTTAEKKIMDQRIESLYALFIKRVARMRNASVKEIEAVAQGRVWTGEEAVRIGLADEIGGLDAALEFLQEELGTKKVRVTQYPQIRTSFLERQLGRMNSEVSAAGIGGIFSAVILHAAGRLFRSGVTGGFSPGFCGVDEGILDGRPLLLAPELIVDSENPVL